VHRASFKVVVDRPVTTPKDEGQAAARPEVRVSSRAVAASSVINAPPSVFAHPRVGQQ
jgi:hypothetical protein